MSGQGDPVDRPATFREVLVSREYLAVFAASALSWFGDYAARAAVTALVYLQTESVAASAAAFAISYLPWLGPGAVLSAIAERHSYRRVMITCDLARMALMALIGFVEMPTSALLVVLFATALLSPPFDAARSALLPQILEGDRYVVGLSLQRIAGQLALVIGYAAGSLLTIYDARLSLLFNAATFGFSAFAIGLWVHERAPSLRIDQRTGLLRETLEGYAVVFRSATMRSIALIVFGGACFAIVPEGLAAAWAARIGDEGQRPGYQAAIMVAAAVGFVVGSLVVSRFVAPSIRVKLIRPFAVLTPLAMVPALFDVGIVSVVAMTLISGAAMAGMMPAANGLFVQVLPAAYRARAFGVMQSGLHLIQGGAVFLTGWLATHMPLPRVVGLFSIVGVVLLVLISLAWPSKATIADAIAANKVLAATRPSEHESRPDGQPLPDFGEDTLDLGRAPIPAHRSRTSAGRPPGSAEATEPPRREPPGRAESAGSVERPGWSEPRSRREPPDVRAVAPQNGGGQAAAPRVGQV